MDGKHDQRLVARRREKAGDQHIGVDHRPDHLTPGATGSFLLRRCAVISASISSGVSGVEPAPLGAGPGLLAASRAAAPRCG